MNIEIFEFLNIWTNIDIANRFIARKTQFLVNNEKNTQPPHSTLPLKSKLKNPREKQ